MSIRNGRAYHGRTAAGGNPNAAPVVKTMLERDEAETTRSAESQQMTLPRRIDAGPDAAQPLLIEEETLSYDGTSGWPGELWAGRYQLVRKIGSGGMGEVFEAIDTQRNGQRVALKRMFATDPRAFIDLKSEYRRMAWVAHPNLVMLYELGVHKEHPFIVMEYAAGCNFYEAVGTGSGRPVVLSRLRALTRQLVLGVLALHEQGLLHRDLKGHNVLVTDEDRLVILDFGLVNEIERRTLFTRSLGRIEGTPLYMSPEQIVGLSSTQSDWYAVGVMLFYSVTGQYPITGSSGELMYKCDVEAPAASALAAGTPADLDELIARLLQRNPSERASGHDILAWCKHIPTALGPSVRKRPPPVPGRFVGRKAPLTVLNDALARFQRRVPLRVDITGPSGAGKTALLRHFLEPLRRDSSFVVLEGRCYEHDSVPFKALDGVIDKLGRYLRWLPRDRVERLLTPSFGTLCQLFPTLGQVRPEAEPPAALLRGLGLDEPELDPQNLRRRAFQVLRNLLHIIAASDRLVLAIDDLQWGDVDSARLISELMAPPGAPPILLVCSYRCEDLATSPMLRELKAVQLTSSRHHDVVAVRIDSLAHEDARELALGLLQELGRATPACAEAIAFEGHGNPMLIESIVRYLGPATEPDDDCRVTRIRPGVSLEHLVNCRLEQLDPDASRLLEIIAVAGQPARLDLLARAASLEREQRSVAGQLRASHFVRTGRSESGDDLVEIYNQRLGRAVLRRMTPAELAERHRALARAIAEAGGEPESLAHHWFAAGELELACEAALEAAETGSRVYALERACKLFRLALCCRPDDAHLRHKYMKALLAAGRNAEAAPLLLEAAELATHPKHARGLRREAGEHFLVGGDHEQGMTVLRPLMAEFDVVAPERNSAVQQRLNAGLAALSRLGVDWAERNDVQLSSRAVEHLDLVWSLCRGLILRDFRLGGLFAVESARLAVDLGEPQRICRSLAMAGVIALERSEPDGTTWLNRAEHLANTLEDRAARAFVALCRGVAHWTRGAWAQARNELEFGIQGLPASATWEHSFAAEGLLASLEALGDMGTLALRSQQMAQVAQKIGSKRSYTLALGYSALTALAEDDVPLARTRLSEVLAAQHNDDLIAYVYALKVGVECDLYVDDVAAAWRRICDAWPALERSQLLDTGPHCFLVMHLRARAGLALWARGIADELRHLPEVIEQDIMQIERERADYAMPIGKLLRAGMSWIRGELTTARRQLTTAIAGFDAAGMAVHATCARRAISLHASSANGRANQEQSEALLRMQGIHRPVCWARLLAPGVTC